MDAIVAYGLTKEYNGQLALDGLNLQVPEGTAMACAGREGSGKTTLIRLLAGLCRPTSGECSIYGMSPAHESAKLHGAAGVVLGSAPLYGGMTLAENLRFFAGVHNVDQNDGAERSSFLLHQLDIWEERDQSAGSLPTSVARRASLARALMHRPRVLLLDDPAQGLDMETAEVVQGLLAYLLEEEGLTLLLCTQNMGFAQKVCGSFTLLREGAMLARGDFDSLREGAGVWPRAALRLAEGGKPPQGFRLEGGLWQKEIRSEEEMPAIIAQAVGEGRSLYEAKLIRPTLEEVYQAYLEGGRRREAPAYGEGDRPEPEVPAEKPAGPAGEGPGQPAACPAGYSPQPGPAAAPGPHAPDGSSCPGDGEAPPAGEAALGATTQGE